MERNTQIKSEDFDSSKSHQLLLDLNQDTYNYALIDDNNNLKILGSSTSAIENAEFLKYQLSNIKVCYFSRSFSIVPSNFEQDIRSFKKLMEINPESETFASNPLNNEIITVYVLNIERQQTLHDLFSHFEIFSQMNPLLKGASSNGTYINIRSSYAEILIIKNSSLNFYNVFEFKNDNELQYFVALVLQQKAIDGKKETINISGDVSEDSLTFQRLKTLFPYLSLIKPETRIKIGEEFKNADLQRYFALLNLASCGS